MFYNHYFYSNMLLRIDWSFCDRHGILYRIHPILLSLLAFVFVILSPHFRIWTFGCCQLFLLCVSLFVLVPTQDLEVFKSLVLWFWEGVKGLQVHLLSFLFLNVAFIFHVDALLMQMSLHVEDYQLIFYSLHDPYFSSSVTTFQKLALTITSHIKT